MTEKWVVGFEIDLRAGVCVLARKQAGEGEIVVFHSRSEAEDWVQSSGEIDAELWDINYLRFDDD